MMWSQAHPYSHDWDDWDGWDNGEDGEGFPSEEWDHEPVRPDAPLASHGMSVTF